jgi:hypothetical protein
VLPFFLLMIMILLLIFEGNRGFSRGS